MYSGLGFRSQRYAPDAHNYQSYVAIREQFLRSPRGRCAKSYGGIVGRLACTLISDAEVLWGPTDEVTVDGLCMWDGHSEYAYWDDYLTDQEIDLICGVYHISTGKKQASIFCTTARSWWPRPSAMEQSGLNVGWWTPLCEQWFEKRLKELQRPQPAPPLTHAKWKHNMKRERQCVSLAQEAERVAAQILERMRP
ncbi:hypothetical protein B0H14DRAFT_2370220 [Mycena olivaceomarginata]|nr:hypothetical protein B0H14DRAFT_2370220 [Mycena olivaceomarginata]